MNHESRQGNPSSSSCNSLTIHDDLNHAYSSSEMSSNNLNDESFPSTNDEERDYREYLQYQTQTQAPLSHPLSSSSTITSTPVVSTTTPTSTNNSQNVLTLATDRNETLYPYNNDNDDHHRYPTDNINLTDLTVDTSINNDVPGGIALTTPEELSSSPIWNHDIETHNPNAEDLNNTVDFPSRRVGEGVSSSSNNVDAVNNIDAGPVLRTYHDHNHRSGGGNGNDNHHEEFDDDNDDIKSSSNKNTSLQSFQWMHQNINLLLHGYLNDPVSMNKLEHAIQQQKKAKEEMEETEPQYLGEDYAHSSLVSTGKTTLMPTIGSHPSGSEKVNKKEPMRRIWNHHHQGSERETQALPQKRRSKRILKKDQKASSKAASPNVVLSILAREATGKLPGGMNKAIPALHRLRKLSGETLYEKVDTIASGICAEVQFLQEAIDEGNWAKTSIVIARIAPRLIGDQNSMRPLPNQEFNNNNRGSEDRTLPTNTPRYYAGGGKIGLERDAFVSCGGIPLLLQVFYEPAFVGDVIHKTNDARSLDEDFVLLKMGDTWKETLTCLRELAYAIPEVVDEGSGGVLLYEGLFLPFLFTLLTHGSCFEHTASLIEEILSIQSQGPMVTTVNSFNSANGVGGCNDVPPDGSSGMIPLPSTTFSLKNVPELYDLWRNFTCRQLAHFTRILALLIFEPEDRHHMECTIVPQSVELLQLRRDRAARIGGGVDGGGQEAIVDQNQAILLGDEVLIRRLLDLLKIMNFAPELSKSSSYHMMAHFPCVADTLRMLGLCEIESFEDIPKLEEAVKKLLLLEEDDSNKEKCVSSTTVECDTATEKEGMQYDEYSNLRDRRKPKRRSELGSISQMLDIVANLFLESSSTATNGVGQFVQIIHIINAAQLTGVVQSRSSSRRGRQRRSSAERQRRSSRSPAPSLSVVINDEDRIGGRRSRSRHHQRLDSDRDRSLTDESGSLHATNEATSLSTNTPASYNIHIPSEPEQTITIGIDDVSEPLRAQQQALIHEHTTPGNNPKLSIHQAQNAANELQFNAFILSTFQVEVLFVLCTLLGGRRKVDAQRMLSSLGIVSVLDEMFERLSWGKNKQEASYSTETSTHGGEGEVGIHGPGCECNPEKALRVQYLRLLHNFCDRECDNHEGRRQLLSESEEMFINRTYESKRKNVKLRDGLLMKIILAFRNEPDDSDCRFWLATCTESWLRGSSPKEQTYCAKSGLLRFLVNYVLSNQLYCSGRLQTAFDLLGELCKGNIENLYTLLNFLDEDCFERLMDVAVSNLVDSNVFIRALLLSVERVLASSGEKEENCNDYVSDRKNYGVNNEIPSAKGFLTHSWWNISSLGEMHNNQLLGENPKTRNDEENEPEWFPPFAHVEGKRSWYNASSSEKRACIRRAYIGSNFDSQIKYSSQSQVDTTLFESSVFDRLAKFLMINQSYLLKELLNEVDLRKINHENICCLNTAILISIFAYRRGELADVVQQLRVFNDNAEGNNLLMKFRELLWFWLEYYTHRGKDRLSLEFSSHLRFQEWKHVVDLLCADNETSKISLTSRPVRLPKSPYRRAPRSPLNMFRAL